MKGYPNTCAHRTVPPARGLGAAFTQTRVTNVMHHNMKQLSTTDLLALASMKNAAKRDM